MTALVIEDDPELQAFLKTVLSSAGFEVVLARNGEEGLARIAASVPDLALVDGILPGMGGIDVCRRIRERRRAQQLPIIFISVLRFSSGKDYSFSFIKISAAFNTLSSCDSGRRIVFFNLPAFSFTWFNSSICIIFP